MTLIADLNAIGKFTVGDGAGISAEYPLTSFRERVQTIAPEGISGLDPLGAGVLGGSLRITWTLGSLAIAAAEDEVPDLIVLLQAQLCRRGQRVRITDFGGNVRDLPKEGTSAGSLLGWPRVSYSESAPESVGSWVFFELEAETIVPKPKAASGGFNLVEHEFELTTDIDKLGLETVRRSGTVRVQNGQNARAYVQAIVVGPAASDAAANDRDFSVRWSEGTDPATCKYEYTDAERGGASGGGVTSSEVNDRTTKQAEGRITRTISGYALGGGATAFATAQRPAPDSTHILLRNEVSAPKVPDGRVDFSYELLSGVVDGRFAGGVVFGFSQSIEESGGGRSATSAVFADVDPVNSLGPIAPYVYTETTSISFGGLDFATALTRSLLDPRMSATAYARRPRIRKSTSREGVRELVITREYIFSTAQTIPDPLEVATPT